MIFRNSGKKRNSFQKPWNIAALVIGIISLLMLAVAVVSISVTPSSTGDYLELKSSISTAKNAGRTSVEFSVRGLRSDQLNPSQLHKPPKIAPMTISAGVYAMQNYGIDPQLPSFSGTGYMWFIWKDDLQEYLQANDLDLWKVLAPVNLIELPNGIDSVFVPTGSDKPTRMANGDWYQTIAYKGKFYIDKADFSRYPFTSVTLPIMIEADDIYLPYDSLRIIPGEQGSGIGQFITPSGGWVHHGWSLAEFRHHYDTDFGFGEGTSDYSQLVFEVVYSSAPWASFWKILIPLFVVMAMIVGATKMDPAQWEVRLAMPVTVMLSLVFMQQTQETLMPDLPYLTFLDEVYVVSYAITLGSFLLMLWGCRRYYNAMSLDDLTQQAEELERLDQSDDSWPFAVILAGLVSLVICWYTN